MEEKVFSWLERHDMLPPGSRVIAALSGGADSVALFHFLRANREKLGISLEAAHFEHGLRGEESLRDAEFVAALCRRCGVTLHTAHGGMAAAEKPKGKGTEEWARELRYRFFDGLARELQAKIALAHTLTDNAETVLFHAVRGAGTKGLAGIPPVRGPYIRPFLCLERRDIEKYCQDNGCEYVTDGTNADDAYSRNRIRNRVMPQLEQVHAGAAVSLGRLALDMRELDNWLTLLAEGLLEEAAVQNIDTRWRPNSPPGEGASTLEEARFFHAGPFLQAAGPVRGKAFSLLAGRQTNRDILARMNDVLFGRAAQTQLPGGKSFKKHLDSLCIEKEKGEDGAEDFEFPVKEGIFELPNGYSFTVAVVQNCQEYEDCEKSGQKGLTFVADYDKILNRSVFRTRRGGDVISLPGRNVTKTVKKWMSEENVPQSLRNKIPVLAGGNAVQWVWGQGFSAEVLPGATTRNWLVIKIQ